MLSKVLESCLLGAFEEFLTSDKLQFRFKKKSSCNHALFTLHESVKLQQMGQACVDHSWIK